MSNVLGPGWEIKKSTDRAYMHVMLGELDRFKAEINRIVLRGDVNLSEQDDISVEVALLMEKLYKDKALSREVLDIITDTSIINLDFRVQVRRFIADRLIVDENHQAFTDLVAWYKKHISKNRFTGSAVFIHDDYAHINMMCSGHLKTPELLKTFSESIPLNVTTAIAIANQNILSLDDIVEAMKLDQYLYPVQDNIVLQNIFNYERERGERGGPIHLADIYRYFEFVHWLAKPENPNRPDLAAKVLRQVLNNPQAKNGTFNVNNLTSYRILFDPDKELLRDTIRENESKVIDIIKAHTIPNTHAKNFFYTLSPSALKKLGTDHAVGLKDQHRDNILYIAEIGMPELARLMSLRSHHRIESPSYLQDLTGFCGPLSQDDMVQTYMVSVAGTSSSMMDTEVTNLTTFLRYAYDHDWEMPWQKSYEVPGIQIVSGRQLTHMAEMIQDAESYKIDREWLFRQLNGALIAMDTLMGDSSFDFKATAEANLDRDILSQLPYYKRMSLSEDLSL